MSSYGHPHRWQYVDVLHLALIQLKTRSRSALFRTGTGSIEAIGLWLLSSAPVRLKPGLPFSTSGRIHSIKLVFVLLAVLGGVLPGCFWMVVLQLGSLFWAVCAILG